MFSRRKKWWEKKEIISTITLFGVAIFALAFFVIPSDSEESGPEIDTSNQVKSASMSNKSIPDESNSDSSSSDSSNQYYLIKETDGNVKIFYCTEDSNELIRTTGISYDLLNKSDQELLTSGIKIKSETELESILEDFES